MKKLASFFLLGLTYLLLLMSCNNNAADDNMENDSTKTVQPVLVPIKVYGATLDEAAIREFYPLNATYPNFDHFLLTHQKDATGDYYVKAFAVEKNGSIIKEVSISKNSPTTPITFNEFEPLDIKIGVSKQLSKLSIPNGEYIKFLKLFPKKYRKHIGYKVLIHVGKTLTDFNKEINPSPPATEDENDWGLQN